MCTNRPRRARRTCSAANSVSAATINPRNRRLARGHGNRCNANATFSST